MRWNSVLTAALLAPMCAAVCHAADLVVAAGPRTPEEERQALHLPPGFEIQLVAAEPEINKPINLAFDDRGRLWVTDTVEYPFPVAPGAKTPDSVKILDDLDENGHARKITTFADNLDIPIGVLPTGDRSALIYSIPYIWRMTDTTGDGFADSRKIFLGPYQHLDTHGMTGSFTEGFDGWIYAVHGYRNTSTIRATDGSQITMNSGNVYRFRRDGSHVEYFTHGQVNPFGLCFDPEGNLFSSDCETMPIAMDLREAYYPSFGKPDDGLGFAPNVVDHFYGSTAIAGLCDYVAEQFPKQYRNRMMVGNVVTNRINDAQLVPRGSGFHGNDVPDFLVSEDEWFRPTNIKLGPDGALYVADFYNRIIGHYEVDLHHPGRDKRRGRIWRIVYRGSDATPAPTTKFDLTRQSVAQMIDDLANTNFTIRMLAMNRLADTVGAPAIEPLKAMLAKTASDVQKVHGLWILYRLGALEPQMLKAAATDSSPLVREHSMRMLAETARWDSSDREMALAGLRDSDPTVRRTAADAVGRHPAFDNIRPLLDVVEESRVDPFLAHVVKIALRDQMLVPGVCPQLEKMQLSARDGDLLAASAVGAPTSEAASFVLGRLALGHDRPADIERDLRMVARYAPADRLDQLGAFAQKRFADDLDEQRSLFQAVLDGLNERGVQPPDSLRAWGSSLADTLLRQAASAGGSWLFETLPGHRGVRSPWGVRPHRSADGNTTEQFLDSDAYGETLIGIARSAPFKLPKMMTFYLAGHNGKPPEVWPLANVVRIRDARTNAILLEAAPPRSDVAQKVTFNLSAWEGKSAYFEAVDGDGGRAYAWLAVGRFNPPVIHVPMAVPQIGTAVKIVAALHLTSLGGRIEAVLADTSAEPENRAAAAQTLGAIGAEDHIAALSKTVEDLSAPDVVREAAAHVLASLNSSQASAALVTAMQTAPQSLQIALAQELASGRGGAEALLAAIQQGKASARLLLDSNVRERLNVVQPANLDQRIAQLTHGLPTADAEIQKLIDTRAAAFDPAKASPERGKLVFQKNCMVCHNLGGQGAHVGPPLDGIGIRGVPRLCEDILDPSRNVAAEFRQSTFVLKDGNVLAGIPRRQEGEAVIIADSTGKEVSIPKAQIARQVESKLSLMPSNFGEIIPEADFDDLLSFLLTTKTK